MEVWRLVGFKHIRKGYCMMMVMFLFVPTLLGLIKVSRIPSHLFLFSQNHFQSLHQTQVQLNSSLGQS